VPTTKRPFCFPPPNNPKQTPGFWLFFFFLFVLLVFLSSVFYTPSGGEPTPPHPPLFLFPFLSTLKQVGLGGGFRNFFLGGGFFFLGEQTTHPNKSFWCCVWFFFFFFFFPFFWLGLGSRVFLGGVGGPPEKGLGVSGSLCFTTGVGVLLSLGNTSLCVPPCATFFPGTRGGV